MSAGSHVTGEALLPVRVEPVAGEAIDSWLEATPACGGPGPGATPCAGARSGPSVLVLVTPQSRQLSDADSGVQFPASTPVAEVTACQFTNPVEAVIKRRAMDHQRPSRGLGIGAGAGQPLPVRAKRNTVQLSS